MGKKTKIGKRRKDKFYHLAKETGYRARAAFKLIQLNRKFQFLQQSRVCIDLCAAPGSWCQVAVNHMPVSSLIVGIDLVPIKPIRNVTCLQADITTSNCRQLLQRELKTWKADCVLHDGAPNVGAAWIQDAFTQAQLTLSAMKLACEFLRKGGWFVTKVFRSKDYPTLLNVFEQLFQKVHATKPQASRIESAEIFVVCQGYLAPKKLDAKLMDPKMVFLEEQDTAESPHNMTIKRLQKPPKSAVGYPDASDTLFKTASVANFIMDDEHMSLLASCNQLVFDAPSSVFSRHPLTTDEIKESCKDVKVLGLRELQQLMRWRKKMREFLKEIGSSDEEEGNSENQKTQEELEDEEEDRMLAKIDEKVQRITKQEQSEVKRLIRKQRKATKKSKERMTTKSEIDQESAELLEGGRKEKLFSLKQIKTQKHLQKVDEAEMECAIETDEGMKENRKRKYESMDESDEEDNEEESISADESEEDVNSEEEEEEEELVFEEQPDNPLVVGFVDESGRKKRSTDMWFSNPVFKGLEDDEDEQEEMEKAERSYQARGGKLLSRTTGNKQLKNAEQKQNGSQTPEPEEMELGEQSEQSAADKETDSSDSDSSDEESVSALRPGFTKTSDGFETVPLENSLPQVRTLDPEGLALGALMVQSKKKREDLIDSAYNRWTHDDDNLPHWFIDDEIEHCRKQLPVTRDMVEEYQRKLREINARPIKKVAEAKARKKKRALKKLMTARKKAEVICDAGDVTNQEKARQLKSVYKKAGLMGQKKQEVKYVVAKKGIGKRARRPAGVSGRFKVVDPRMKKDRRGTQSKGKQGRRRDK